jgi:Putative DNA-binding domain
MKGAMAGDHASVASTPADREAARQQQLMAAIADSRSDAEAAAAGGPRSSANTGLRIYRANAHAVAERALAAAFPTLRALIGAQDFRQMAREYWRDDPPLCGDMARWGAGLPQWLRGHAAFWAWPYLGDCAELDWLRHECESAEDADFDAESLALLEAHDPRDVMLLLTPGTALLESRWPVATLFAAHQAGGGALTAARDALAAQRGEGVLVARKGWRAAVHSIEPVTGAWLRGILGGVSLAQALEAAAPGFDFTAWLTRALGEGWLQRVSLRPR